MGDDEPSQSGEIEINPINPKAHRIPSGVWNEDVLPVLEWEVAEHRVVLPEDLQPVLACPVPVLRWASIKYRSVVAKHERDRPVIENLDGYLNEWEWVGEETGAYIGQHRVLIQDDMQRWYTVTIGEDRNGSYNIITVFGGSDRGFLGNRKRHRKNIVRREKEPSARAADLASLESAGAAGGEAVSRHEGYFHHQL